MSSTPPAYDAVVVGARAAGAATAMLLARAGRRVLVLDRSRYGADTLSTHALMRGAVLQLHRWGLLDRVIAAGTPPVRQAVFSYDHGRVVVPVKPSPGVDALYAPRRTLLDPILVDAAEAAGAEVRFGVTVTDLKRERGWVRGVIGRDEDGRHVEIDAPLVIGADGVRSVVARCVGARVERTGTGATAVISGYWSGLETEGFEWIFTPRASAGLIPTNAGETCVFVGGTARRVGAGRLRTLHEMLREAAPDVAARVAAASEPVGVRSFGGRPGFIRRSWGPGWALVGDAGYWKDPLSAHGLTDAFRDAELLARAVVGAGDGDPTDALARYQAERDRMAAPLFRAVDRVAALHWTNEEIPGLLMQVSAAMTEEVTTLEAFEPIECLAGARLAA